MMMLGSMAGSAKAYSVCMFLTKLSKSIINFLKFLLLQDVGSLTPLLEFW